MRAQDEPSDIGSTGLSLLGRLRTGPATATALAEQECLKLQSLTRTLRALEEDGLIERAPDESDRRRTTIAITPAGLAVLQQTARKRASWLADVMTSELSPIERDLLRLTVGLIERLADAAPDEES